MMSYLIHETRISTTMIAKDSAAETVGRRSSTSQKKLSRPQVRIKESFGTIPASLQAMSASAVT
jgi:hypothetical protein